MRSIYSIFLCILIIFWSCQTSEDKKSSSDEKNVKNIVFDLKSDASRYRVQSYYDKEAKEERVCFTDTHTDKIIKFYDTKGNLLHKTPLDSASIILQNIESLKVVSLDTIILHSHQENKLVFINRFGKIWKRLILSSILKDDKGNCFKIGFINIIEKGELSIIASVFWENNEKKAKPSNHFDYLRDYSINANRAPFVCKISKLFATKPTVDWGMYGFYQNLGNVADWYMELRGISFINNNLFLYSIYTDTLYQVQQNLALERKIKISSTYTKVGHAKPLKTDDNSLQKIIKEKTYNLVGRTAGYVEHLGYDKNKEKYYISVFHQIPITTPEENSGNDNRPFSILVFDKQFKKIKEVFFDNKTYNSHPISIQKGVFLVKKTPPFSPKNKSKAHEKVIITPFYFDE